MADKNMNFPIPNEVLGPYIREAVSASITAALGDGTKVVEKAVQAALRTKVDENGDISSSSYCNNHNLIEVLAKKKIIEIAKETMNEMAEGLRPHIRREIEKNIRDNPSKYVRAMENALVDGLAAKWSVSVYIKDAE